MKNNKKASYILVLITIVVFIITVIGATYAYFASEKTIGSSINANVETASSMYSFTASSPDTIEMTIAFNEMSEDNVSNTVLKNDSASIAVSLSSPNDDILTSCTYDIIWVWDDGDIYDMPDGGTLPIVKDGVTYNYEFSTTVDGKNEIDLSSASKKDGNKVKIQEGVIITSTSTIATTKNHEIKANIYNLPISQTNLFGKNFKAHVTIDNLSCNMVEYKQTLAYHIINTVYNSPKNHANITADPKQSGLYFHDDNLANSAVDNTYRYSGADADVDNYVCFSGDNCTEDNLYRIISVDSNTKQTKVIKATSIGNMAWNSAGINTWVGSSLETYLNGTYLTGLRNKTKNIVPTLWKVGGFPDGERYSSNPKQIYNKEMADTITYSADIGLMTLSEYGFAALPNVWASNLGYYQASKGNDWILTNSDNYPWTISPHSDNTTNAFRIDSGYGVMGRGGVSRGNGVRPTFTLSSNAKITNANVEGVGSSETPMIIA